MQTISLFIKRKYIIYPQGVVNLVCMAQNVTQHVPATADTKHVIFTMELVLGVYLDIKEHFVQWVSFVLFYILGKQDAHRP